MAYYLLTVRRPGSVHYKEAAVSKHYIDAPDLEHAKADAEIVLDNHYPGKKLERAVIQLYDQTGCVATCIGNGPWDH